MKACSGANRVQVELTFFFLFLYFFPGGAYWRSSAITGQGFFDKMGWCGSADPRKRPTNTKHGEADQMRRDIDEIRERREAEHQDNNSSEGLELVPLMKNQSTGR